MSPNQYYGQSPFLFWAILSTGARKYHQDSTVLEKSSKRLMEIALPSLFSLEGPICAIQAVMLLCMWPLPMSTTFKDPSFAFSGAATQIAIQSGLHIAGHEQDYSRARFRRSDEERTFRARTWIHWTIIFQRHVPCCRCFHHADQPTVLISPADYHSGLLG